MTITDFVLIALVWAVVGLAVAVWRLRRDVRDLIATCGYLVDDYIDRRTTEHPAPPLVIKDATSDLPVPDVDDHPDAPDTPTTPTYRPVPPEFPEWR
ncbi:MULTISPECIES: hypothetical protein [unclassified Corynebacterium]|uniref:hypothetical protein n=1 Tax=unclassified Corynebacterium TaxID=2624378 RepID=UPI004033C796